MPCPICEETANWPITHRSDPQIDSWRSEIGDRRPQHWQLCRRCGNAFPSVQPELQVLQRVWQTARAAACANAGDKAAVWRDRSSVARMWAQRSCRLLSPLAPRVGRFLDIACGLGETVRAFADHGWNAEGIDADPCMAAIHQKLGITSRIGQFERMDLEGRYDVIQIAHAIYFVTEPMNFISKVRKHLAHDGLFCVLISNFMSNVSFDLPSYSHSFLPTGASLRYAMAMAGFETVLSQSVSGSIYVVGRPTPNQAEVEVHPRIIRLGYNTKKARYLLIGVPYLGLRNAAKRCSSFFYGTPATL